MKMKKTVFCAVFFLSLLCISGCSIAVDSHDEEIIPVAVPASYSSGNVRTVRGSICLDGAYPSRLFSAGIPGSSVRSAVTSSEIITGYKYVIEATNASGTNTATVDVTNADLSFSFSLSAPETWSVKAYLADAADVSDRTLLASSMVVLTDENPVPEVILNVVPKTTGTVGGRIELPISINTVANPVNNVIFESSDPALNIKWESGKILTDGDTTPAGTYSVRLMFKKGTDVVFSCRETINVYDGYVTDSWWGSSRYLKENTAPDGTISYEFELTDSVISDMTQKEIYIDAASTDPDGHMEGADYVLDKSGSILKPFNTLNAAFKRLEEINDGISKYRIVICSDITCGNNATDYSVMGENMVDVKNSAMYQKNKNLDLTIESSTSERKIITGKTGIRIMNFYSGGSGKMIVTMANLEFVGGGNSEIDGGAIRFYSYSTPGSLFFDNVRIKGAKAKRGGGIYSFGQTPSASITCTLNNESEISECTAEDAGGGVFLNGSDLVVNANCFVSKNKALTTDMTLDDFGGGGIYAINRSAVYLGDGYITSNASNSVGGGICIKGSSSKIEMLGGQIGGLIDYNPSSLFTGNYVDNADGVGAGVFVGSGATFKMTGGLVSRNKNSSTDDTKLYGNGIYLQFDSKFCIGDGASVNSSNDVSLGGGMIEISQPIVSSFAARITYNRNNSSATDYNYVLRDEQDIDLLVNGSVQVLKGGSGYTLTSEDCSKFAISSDSEEYANISAMSDKNISYKYYLDVLPSDHHYGIVKRTGIISTPSLPGIFKFVLDIKEIPAGATGNLSFTVTDGASPVPNVLTPTASSIAIQQMGNDLYKVTSSTSTIAALNLTNPLVAALPAGTYDIRMTATFGSLEIDEIQSIRILAAGEKIAVAADDAVQTLKTLKSLGYGTETNPAPICISNYSGGKKEDSNINDMLTELLDSTSDIYHMYIDLRLDSPTPVDFGLGSVTNAFFTSNHRIAKFTVSSNVTIKQRVLILNQYVKEVVLEEGLTDIDQVYMLDKCRNLEKIQLPSTLTNLAGRSITECPKATFEFPEGNSVFTTIDGGNAIVKNGNNLVVWMSEAASITVPPYITNITRYCFSGCKASSITIPDTVTSVEDAIFDECKNLSTVVLPAGLTELPRYSFCSSGLTTYTIPTGIETVCEYAFSYCTSLTSVTIPYTVNRLQYNAFYDCTNLSSITIPSTVEYIGSGVLEGTSVTSVTLPTPQPGKKWCYSTDTVNFSDASAFTPAEIAEMMTKSSPAITFKQQ